MPVSSCVPAYTNHCAISVERVSDVRTEEEKAGGAEKLPQMPILWSRADNCHRQMHVSQSTSYCLPV